MPSTYRAQSKAVLGYVAPLTEENAEYIATVIIQKDIDKGLGADKIALKWNAGHTGSCSKGVNRFGVEYNSCAYVAMVKSNL